MNNDANEVALKISFELDDPTLARKMEMMGGDLPDAKVFRIQENF
jgi:hypothetical protein